MNAGNSKRMLTRAVPLLAAGLVALAASGAASADSWRHHRPRAVERVVYVHHYDGEDRIEEGERYNRLGGRHHRRPERRVVHVYHHYPEPPPRVVYYEERVYQAPAAAPVYQAPAAAYPAPARAGNSFTAQSLLGAALGGLIGSRIGGGTGNQAATAAGAVTGLIIGSRYGR